MKNYFLIAGLLLPLMLWSQTGDENAPAAEYFTENYVRYANYTYSEHIQTVQVHPETDELAEPVISLNTPERLKCSFDDLQGGVKQYMYRMVLCDAYWRPGELPLADYLEGYTEDYIRDYAFSFNTLQNYTHYSFLFPGENMRIKVSGNYLLLVYPEGQPEAPVLTARFYVVENTVRIEGKVRQAIDLEERYERQQVQFSIFSDAFSIVNPYQNLIVSLQQNGREDNRIQNLKPVMVKGNELDYNHITGNVFDGGNEFRHFEIKSIKYTGDRVMRIEPAEGLYQVLLFPDERRSQKSYITEQDLNGKYVVRTLDGTEPDIEADYVEVHFFLPFSPYYSNGNVYVCGAFNQWELSKKSLMTYNFNRKGYEYVKKLKQGYYNYLYLMLENGQTTANVAFMEGNHFETGNEYLIRVYYREPGKLYDRLIAVKSLK